MDIRRSGAGYGAIVVLWASLVLAAHGAEKAETPQSNSVTTPLMAVDAQLHSDIKEYIGLRSDKEGSVFLTVTKGAKLDAVAQLAREVWLKAAGDEKAARLPNFDFNEVAVSGEQLNAAFQSMRDVLTIKDVASLDLDEACGCLNVGVLSDSAFSRVTEFAAKHRIPKELVQVAITQPVMRTLDLRDEYRPNMGGIQIQNKSAATCTLGLPVFSFNKGTYGFLTASHCTEGTQGAMMGTGFYQRGGTWFGTDWIGDEVLDLALFNSNTDTACPMGRMCRRSDAAFGEYRNSQHYVVGRVMQAVSACAVAGGTCPLTVARETDDIRMVGAISGLFTGTNVDKVGRTSGWTRGAITSTCTDINVFDRGPTGTPVDTGITILCQYTVATTSQPGDSGSPVFEFNASTDTGWFAGILWGGSFDGTSMIFSPINSIDAELGSFVYNQKGVAAPFLTNGRFYTSNPSDELDAHFDLNAVPPDEIEIVLNAGANAVHRKEIVLVEGFQAGIGRWTIRTDSVVRTDRNGLYLYQLPNGRLEFRKQIGGGVFEVSRVPIDTIPGGTRITFTWLTD
jgi:hypothetical protein